MTLIRQGIQILMLLTIVHTFHSTWLNILKGMAKQCLGKASLYLFAYLSSLSFRRYENFWFGGFFCQRRLHRQQGFSSDESPKKIACRWKTASLACLFGIHITSDILYSSSSSLWNANFICCFIKTSSTTFLPFQSLLHALQNWICLLREIQ